MVHRKVRAITLVTLMIVFAPTFVYVLGVATNNPCCVPPEKVNVIPMRFGIYLTPIFVDPKSGIPLPADINLGIWVRFNGTLTPDKQAIVTAAGYLGTQFANYTVDLVDVYFKFSLAYPIINATDGLPAETRLTLYRTFFNTMPLFEAGPISITWPNPGDYAPSVDVVYWNHTLKERDAPVKAVHVETLSEIQTENVNRINTGLTYALVAFGVIEISLGLSEYVEGILESRNKSVIKTSCNNQTGNHS